MSRSNHTFKDLDALNLDNLFPSKDGSRCSTNGKLDINTLFGHNNAQNFTFDSNILLEGIKRKKEKLEECHKNIFKSCCKFIMSANKLDMTDIIFEVPIYISECQLYNSYNCLLYIKEKLKEHNISSVIHSKVKIFITWNDIEEKLSKKKIK